MGDTVEALAFSTWCEHNLPYPRGSLTAHKTDTQGMVLAIGSLLESELTSWIADRDRLAHDLGRHWKPDAILQRIHFYEHARERIHKGWHWRLL
jgi:hypothetical protein